MVRGIFIGNVTGVDIRQAPVLEGLEGAPFEGICMTNVQLDGIGPPATWHRESVVGDAVGSITNAMFPTPEKGFFILVQTLLGFPGPFDFLQIHLGYWS